MNSARYPLHFIDPTATVHPTARVWHYSVVLAHVTLREGVNIGSCCEIGRGTTIGARTRVGTLTFIPSNARIGSGVFIGPHVMMCDDEHPFVRTEDDGPYRALPPVIEDGAVIGAGAILLPGVHIGAKARIGAGAIVTRDVPDGAFVRGEPARERALSSGSREAWAR